MVLSDLAVKWEVFLRDRFSVVCSIHSGLSLLPDVIWPYPPGSCHLVADGVNVGCVLSLSESRDATDGIIGRHGFMALGGSMKGSMLIMKVAVDSPEVGCCRWIAPDFEYREDSDFDGITSDVIADPISVITQVLRSRGDYYEDISFDDDYWSGKGCRDQ